MSVEIREMTEDDIPAVQAVAATTWEATYQGIVPEQVQAEFLRRSYSAEMLRHRIQRGLFLVALEQERLLGFADFAYQTDGAVELAAIYVLPQAQARGIGSRLLESGLMRLAGASHLRILVERDNWPARRFYEARGCRVVGEYVERIFNHDFNVVEMTLPGSEFRVVSY